MIGRNTLGGPSAVLRLGPWGRNPVSNPRATVPPPYGVGSVGLIVGSGDDKIVWGNESDFAGTRLSGINTLAYSVFEGETPPLTNTPPNLILEVDPNLDPDINFTSLVFLPLDSTSPAAPARRLPSNWERYTPSAPGSAWWATNSETASATGCTLSSPCSFSELKDALPDAVITFSLGINKGRDTPFVGAVDGVRVNNRIFDFEPQGVRELSAVTSSKGKASRRKVSGRGGTGS
ncbi:hypothetical protein ETD86_39830 [Nonomuraea turkmeniaca]|uniref:Uncharacterized protein n=1 Tax=Nonomuraea turkmeniaca TaxID=103838 RepID=A0A5S4F2R1_9ACTN|nr:hypothetical protein [Nonomuraea turkmeniaca]TMR10387.1 hypothetical protein ETD86_39830 [Nonomuraea turkmeniaca]